MDRLFLFDSELNKRQSFIEKQSKINFKKTEYEYYIKNLKKPEYVFSKSPLLSNENHWPNNKNKNKRKK